MKNNICVSDITVSGVFEDREQFISEKITEPIVRAAADEDIAGAALCVLHKGETVLRFNVGYADKEKNIPIKNDTIYRMFSMTKPVTSALAAKLWELGVISPDEPVKKYFPEADAPKILDENGLRDSETDILISDLLNMTSGLSYPEETPSGRKAGAYFYDIKTRLAKGEKVTTEEFARLALRSPLAFAPGKGMLYGTSADVLGAVLEKAADMRFGELIEKYITKPLGMNDTGFYILPEKYHRLSQIYYADDIGGLVPFEDLHLCLTDYSVPPSFESGGAGLVSTVDDYLKFGEMLLNGGIYRDVRILSEKTVKYMRTPHVPQSLIDSMNWDSMKHYGYSCLMRTRTSPSPEGENAGIEDFGWDGWTGNYFTADPAADTVFLYFIQKCGAGTTPLCLRVKSAVYEAVMKN